MSLCLSKKCKDYNSGHSDAVLCSLCNCWSDSGCHHSDVRNDILLRNDFSNQGIDQQIFNRKSISRKITHPQSLFK